MTNERFFGIASLHSRALRPPLVWSGLRYFQLPIASPSFARPRTARTYTGSWVTATRPFLPACFPRSSIHSLIHPILSKQIPYHTSELTLNEKQSQIDDLKAISAKFLEDREAAASKHRRPSRHPKNLGGRKQRQAMIPAQLYRATLIHVSHSTAPLEKTNAIHYQNVLYN